MVELAFSLAHPTWVSGRMPLSLNRSSADLGGVLFRRRKPFQDWESSPFGNPATFRTRCRTICRARIPRRRCKSLSGKDFGPRKNAFYGLFVRHRCRTKPPKEAYDRKAAARDGTNRSRPRRVPFLFYGTRRAHCFGHFGQNPPSEPCWWFGSSASPYATMIAPLRLCGAGPLAPDSVRAILEVYITPRSDPPASRPRRFLVLGVRIAGRKAVRPPATIPWSAWFSLDRNSVKLRTVRNDTKLSIALGFGSVPLCSA